MGYCPKEHPFAYDGGQKCCKHGRESWDLTQREGCDGSEITMDSTCCAGKESVTCAADTCEADTCEVDTCEVDMCSNHLSVIGECFL